MPSHFPAAFHYHDRQQPSGAHIDSTSAKPMRTPFSVREALSAPGDAAARFERCFAEGRDFIERTSITGLLQSIFADPANRQVVEALVRGPLHVGFLFPESGLTREEMGAASARAGFSADWSTFPSTVVARELGSLAGCERVPTLIFSAATNGASGRRGYVEAFIPSAGAELTRRWVRQEVASHVGLALADPAAGRVAHQAFLREGYAVAPFMQKAPIPNPDAGVAVVYYDKPCAHGATRIEVLYPVPGVAG